jgi:hypothetical protein
MAQSGGTVSKTDEEHADSERGMMACGDAVDTSTRMYCSGRPTRRWKVLHEPSLPSLLGSRSQHCWIRYLK